MREQLRWQAGGRRVRISRAEAIGSISVPIFSITAICRVEQRQQRAQRRAKANCSPREAPWRGQERRGQRTQAVRWPGAVGCKWRNSLHRMHEGVEVVVPADHEYTDERLVIRGGRGRALAERARFNASGVRSAWRTAPPPSSRIHVAMRAWSRGVLTSEPNIRGAHDEGDAANSRSFVPESSHRSRRVRLHQAKGRRRKLPGGDQHVELVEQGRGIAALFTKGCSAL